MIAPGLPHGWTSHPRKMCSSANVSQQLRRLDRKHALAKVPKTMQTFLAYALDHRE